MPNTLEVFSYQLNCLRDGHKSKSGPPHARGAHAVGPRDQGIVESCLSIVNRLSLMGNCHSYKTHWYNCDSVRALEIDSQTLPALGTAFCIQ
jgi:hypothetical protein